MMKALKITNYVSTGLLSVMMFMSAGRYIFDYETMSQLFETLGHPGYVVIPLAVVKLLGITAIWTNKVKFLKEFAYAGFLFNFLLAGAAHIAIGDGKAVGAGVALVLWTISYVSFKKRENALVA